MKFMPCIVITLGLAGIGLVGCSENAPVTVTPPPAIKTLEVALDEINKAGEMGSIADELPRLVEEIKAADPDKGSALQKDLDELLAARGSAAVRAKAKAMSTTLTK
ncbi:hypothetical protein AB1L30_23960 [Bremerella sp. JC817]|uniref:hypothetical protein n=1 Tax=Bremerella sp. JC817 TaxID=3231756 RepID=UPI0034591188